jgi:hypothetical protein
VGAEVTTLYHLDKPMYLLGYLAAQSRVYLIDRWVGRVCVGGGRGGGGGCSGHAPDQLWNQRGGCSDGFPATAVAVAATDVVAAAQGLCYKVGTAAAE